MTYVPPSVGETAFNCPHCKALAKQFWFKVWANELPEEQPLPVIVYEGDEENFSINSIRDINAKEAAIEWFNKMAQGIPFVSTERGGIQVYRIINNLNISKCFNCKNVAIWIQDTLVYPKQIGEIAANPDMPIDIQRDYSEASAILDASPRGAAALIRLAIQKLCKELGQPGKNINDDIAALVKGGLDVRVQKALDVVRVIGNSAVHPGQIDLRDDRATATTLLKMLNLIVDKTISEPKHISEVYDSLPQSQLKAIEKRDGNGF